MFQAGIIKLCNQKTDISSEIEERVAKIEKYLKSGKGMVASNINQAGQSSMSSVAQIGQRDTNNVSAVRPANLGTSTTSQVSSKIKSHSATTTKKFSNKSEEYWPQIVNDLKQSGKIVLYTNLIGTAAKELNDMTVGIEFPNGMSSFGKTVLEKQENIREISNLVSMACGKEMQIKYLTSDAQQTHQMTSEESLQNFANESDIPFHIIE